MKKLLIASYNPGKLVEYRELLNSLPIELISPGDEGINLDVVESGGSFEENAALKARAFARVSRLPILADDSGLEVLALDGAPGIHTSRYAGPHASDADRYRKLLAELAEVPWERRQARFRCVIAIATPQGALKTVEGSVSGRIAFQPRGKHGFGYDPVFYLPRYKKTMAELPEEIKNQISHRAVAVRKAIPLLQQMLGLQ